MIARLVTAACEFVASRAFTRVFHTNGDPYLSRFRLLTTSLFAVQLHKFHRSDADRELHNHPWSWAVSLVLTGGYSEERRIDDMVWRKTVSPGTVNVLTADTFHRVDLLDERAGAWTLFVTGPKAQSWSFWDRNTKVATPWREHLARRGDA